MRHRVNGGHEKRTPRLKRWLAPLMGVTGVTGSNSRDRERKAKGKMSRITIRTEADFPTNETLETAQGRVSARFPSAVNPLWCLASVDVATAPVTVTVASVDTRSADEAV